MKILRLSRGKESVFSAEIESVPVWSDENLSGDLRVRNLATVSLRIYVHGASQCENRRNEVLAATP